jgi:hypothetical protein
MLPCLKFSLLDSKSLILDLRIMVIRLTMLRTILTYVMIEQSLGLKPMKKTFRVLLDASYLELIICQDYNVKRCMTIRF